MDSPGEPLAGKTGGVKLRECTNDGSGSGQRGDPSLGFASIVSTQRFEDPATGFNEGGVIGEKKANPAAVRDDIAQQVLFAVAAMERGF